MCGHGNTKIAVRAVERFVHTLVALCVWHVTERIILFYALARYQSVMRNKLGIFYHGDKGAAGVFLAYEPFHDTVGEHRFYKRTRHTVKLRRC